MYQYNHFQKLIKPLRLIYMKNDSIVNYISHI